MSSTKLCDFCGIKPKYKDANGQTFDFCSKTCAGQSSADLCKFCNKAPKYQKHDYCTKRCGTLAKAQSSAANPKLATSHNAHNRAQNKSTPKSNTAGIAVSNTLTQLATLLPQAQALLSGLSAAAAPPAPNKSANSASRAPAHDGSQFVLVSQGARDQKAKAQNNSTSAICLIPNCNKPAYSVKGVKVSDYCSVSHREEALNPADTDDVCIMCLVEPQGDADHFCSEECRERALNKPIPVLPEEVY